MTPHACQEISDSALLRAFADTRDQQAFSELVARYAPLVRGVCRRICPTVADDAAQNVFILLANKASKLRAYHSLGGWLHRTATHVAMTTREAMVARQRREHEVAMSAQPDLLEASNELVAELDAAVQSLPDGLRKPLVMHYFERLPVCDLAERLGMTADATAMRLSRARERLRTMLGRRRVVSTAIILSLLNSVRADICPAFIDDTLTALQAPNHVQAVSTAFARAPRRWSAARIIPACSAIVAVIIISALMWPGHEPRRDQSPQPLQQAAVDTEDEGNEPVIEWPQDGAEIIQMSSARPYVHLKGGASVRGGVGYDSKVAVTVWADRGRHHLAPYPQAAEAAMGTVVSIKAHAIPAADVIKALSDNLRTGRSLPVIAEGISGVMIAEFEVSQRPLREVLDLLCDAGDLSWDALPEGIVVHAAPAKTIN
jgi:RNA polymerase sigma factor (sigma-70 family)